MKNVVTKKLSSLDLRIQLALVAVGLVVLAVAAYMLVVSPQHAEAAKLRQQVSAVQTQIYARRAEVRKGLHPPTIETADLFRLSRAMPDREDMPGMILTLSEVAQSAGIKFDLIAPVQDSSTLPVGNYQIERIHLLFHGDFYALSDFLYRLRSLVLVHNGALSATGRLFNVDTLTFTVSGNSFPQIQAELFVDAYIYGSAPAAAPVAPTPTTTTPTTTTPSATAPTGATAVGPTG